MFDIRKAAADDKQRIAGLQRFLGGSRPEQAYPSCAMGMQVRKRRFTEQRFGNRRREPLRDAQRTATGENANLPCR